MKTLSVFLIALLLSISAVIAGEPKRVYVPKDRPFDMLASIREQVILETVQITVIEKIGVDQKQHSFTGTDLIVYQDSAMWQDSGVEHRVATDDIVCVTTQPESNVALGAGIGLLIGGITGGLVGVAIGDAEYSNEAHRFFPRTFYQNVDGALGALIGGLTGALIGGAAGTAKDATTWVFEH